MKCDDSCDADRLEREANSSEVDYGVNVSMVTGQQMKTGRNEGI